MSLGPAEGAGAPPPPPPRCAPRRGSVVLLKNYRYGRRERRTRRRRAPRHAAARTNLVRQRKNTRKRKRLDAAAPAAVGERTLVLIKHPKARGGGWRPRALTLLSSFDALERNALEAGHTLDGFCDYAVVGACAGAALLKPNKKQLQKGAPKATRSAGRRRASRGLRCDPLNKKLKPERRAADQFPA
ncbi:hypothetical protein EVAR_30839_1 [Eumeta japonica]|uniref:Uncharacterized protein n=1 Tax=Eumeta variegata TaxID=151549 RepID=A0A4C1XPM8_EUMVA|nr:hypothetical protein EVAR_30839_1 [Eumeta japonica]